MENELKAIYDKYISDLNNLRNEYEDKIKLIKINYEKNKNEIMNKYKALKESNDIIYKKDLESLDNKYIKIIQECNYNNRIDNMSYIKRLNEIVYNTYNMYNNNYYNAININNILVNSVNQEINKREDLKTKYEDLIKIKNEKEKIIDSHQKTKNIKDDIKNMEISEFIRYCYLYKKIFAHLKFEHLRNLIQNVVIKFSKKKNHF